jgi:3-methyladenine DNA glycosylase AlkC
MMGVAMAEPFKNLIHPGLIVTAARHLGRVRADFPVAEFVRLACTGLEALELKQRVQHVTNAFVATLPPDFDDACAMLEASLAPARDDDDLKALVPGEHGLAGWIVWPMTEFVAARGLIMPDRALAALRELTQRWTAEYAIRPFLVEHEKLTLATLGRWTRDGSAHVRRLCSEGSRPRLPWGLQLKRFVADPSPTMPILRALQDDPSEYVRRSVANHLNDIAKDHPDVVADWLEHHLPGAPPPRRALLKHASRTLVKRGDRRVLAAWGIGAPLRGEAVLTIAPKRVRLGGAMQVVATLRSTAKKAQQLAVDYVVHHRKQDGSARPKVWKGWQLELAAGEARELRKKHSWKPTTIRTDHPGRHAVDLVVNGKVVARSVIDLRA